MSARGSSNRSSGLGDEVTHHSGPYESEGTNNDTSSTSMQPSLPAQEDRPPANIELYSTASRMVMVVVDCFDELFTPRRRELDVHGEIEDAINTGMSPRWSLIEAARTHRALNTCMRLQPGTVLYETIFTRLTKALRKAFSIQGTDEQQKAVFLMETTTAFDVVTMQGRTEYYFDNLNLVHPLFHADILITRVLHKYLAYPRFYRAPRPKNFGVRPANGWQWTRNGEPLVRGTGIIARTKSEAKSGGESIRDPRKLAKADKTAATHPVERAENADGSGPDASEPDDPTRTGGNRRQNAAAKKNVWTEKEIAELVKAVPVYGSKYADIERAIAAGRIPIENKNRGPQSIRAGLLAHKRDLLLRDQNLPKGFDDVIVDKVKTEQILRYKKNPWRKEKDVDCNGKPTNTDYDPTQNPALGGQSGRRRAAVAKKALATNQSPEGTPAPTASTDASLSAYTVGNSSAQGGPVRQSNPAGPNERLDFGQASGLGGQEGSGEQSSGVGQGQPGMDWFREIQRISRLNQRK